MRSLVLAALALLPGSATAQTSKPRPGFTRVRIATSLGPIVVALDRKRAPATTANFLAYVDDGRFDGTVFYRATRNKWDARTGFVQGGIRTDARRILPSFPLETTARTGIRHLDMTISMARGSAPGSAGGNFFITVGPSPGMDARPGSPGYAAFGRVVEGQATVKRILAVPTGGGLDAFKGQMILRPVAILTARRLDGKPQPTDQPRTWLINVGRRPSR